MTSSSVLILVLFSLSALIAVVEAQNPDIGRIFIGTQDPSTDQPIVRDYTFSSSDLTGKSLPVYALVFSGSSSSQTVPKTEDITISCQISDTGPSFSGVATQAVNLPTAQNSTNIPLSLTTSGRSVQVTCSGESVSATCPIAVGGAQFCPATSESNAVPVTILPPGTVSHCELQVRVPNAAAGTSLGFSVRLSEQAIGDVTVTCTSTPVGGTGLALLIQPLVISSGSSTGMLNYTVQSGVAGSEADVVCRAQSQAGSQFVSSNLVEASTARFVLAINSLKLQPVLSKVYNTTFTSFFTLSEPITVGSLNVSCQATVVASVQVAESAIENPDCSFTTGTSTQPPTVPTTTTAAPTTDAGNGTTVPTPVTPAPTPPPDPTSPWRVVNASFQISSNLNTGQTIYYPVTVQRLRQAIDERTEVIVTTCCVLPSSTNSNFQGQSTVAVGVADIAPLVCPKCSSSNITNPKQERVIQNPGYVELAPCACDLTSNKCDRGCCCDKDCSSNEIARFLACIPGLPGGQPAEEEEYKCSSHAFNRPDWHLITCVYWESNAYLGMYYMNQAKLNSFAEISRVVSREQEGHFSFSETERRYENKDSQQLSYQYGTIVRTRREDILPNQLFGVGILALSQPGPGGACNPQTPVRFLVDTSSVCKIVVSNDLCTSLSPLSGRVYAVSSVATGCSQSFKVAKNFQAQEVTPADVRYYCATDLTPYLPPVTVPLENQDPTIGSNFPPDLANVNCSSGCADMTCWGYNTGRGTEASPPLPPSCPWDNGFSAPRIPGFAGTTCENVVLEVRYNFEWRGSDIVQLTADVILGNIPNVQISEVEIVQKFSVKWQHRPNATVQMSDNYADTTEPYQRSGSGGYDLGKPLISGCAEINSTTDQFEQVDTIPEKQMAIWRPGVDGLCETAQRQPVTFGDDMWSGCALKLTFDDLNNTCADLRNLVTNHLNVLMAGDVIGRYGNNDANDLSMWIPVIRQNLDNITSESVDSGATNINSSAGGPEDFQTWADSITGICLLPTAINLNILYAQTGATFGYPQYEVVGAYINYTVSNWTLDCMGINQRRCQAGSAFTQNFILSSSVTYIKVPPTSPPAKSRFYTRCDPDNFHTDSCYRFFTDFGTDECYYETCWQELAYPVLPIYEGDYRRYTLPFFLVLVLGVVGYVAAAKPGWS